MIANQEFIDLLLAECERQAEAWEKIDIRTTDLTEPFRDEKYKILLITFGYIGRMLELYHDTILVLEDDRLLSGVILARASVESAAMMCFFHEQIKKHFGSSLSPDCIGIMDRHLSGIRHKTSEPKGEEIRGFHINDAIKKGNEFAQRIDNVILSNVEVLVPGAEVIDYKMVDELGPFGWIYSILSEFSHPNPLSSRRYFGESVVADEIAGAEAMRGYIAVGLSTTPFYAGTAVNALFAVCGVEPDSR